MQTPVHGETESNVVSLIRRWTDRERTPGKVVWGHAGFRLTRDPDTLVGVDAAYVSSEVARRDPGLSFYDGPPVLAIEILGSSDLHGEGVERAELYREVGSIVRLVDPDFRAITVHRPAEQPVGLNRRADRSGDPCLLGSCVRVADVFEGISFR